MNGNDSASAADAQRGVALIRSHLAHRPLTAASPTSLAACDVPPETCPPGEHGALSVGQDKVTGTKPGHLAWMPGPPCSVFAFGAASFFPASLHGRAFAAH